MGTRTNITFLGKGTYERNPLFQSPVGRTRGRKLKRRLGPRESIIGAVEDAMGFAFSSGKLNSIHSEILGLNPEAALKIFIIHLHYRWRVYLQFVQALKR